MGTYKEIKNCRIAQSSIEFFVLLGFVLFVFVAFIFVIQTNIWDKSREANNLAFREIAFIVQDEIALASESSDGYFRDFELPQKVRNLDYEINIVDEFVYVRTADGAYALALPVLNVTGEVYKGTNMIRKMGGKVYLNS